MTNITPFFDGFHIRTLSRKRSSAGHKLHQEIVSLKQKNLSQLSECFRCFIPEQLLKPSLEKQPSRRRLFSKENTFRAFFSQIDADGGCMEIVRKMQALRQWEPHLNHMKINKRERRRIISRLYDAIAENEVPLRPGRSEPR